ncbi:MAG: amidohydrolase family protein [Actinomycetota bacterium]|nr:amidohydrolase family protein [Actinomycetota bacterium]
MSFLPEPGRRDRHFAVISVDDHIVEPPELFRGRVPSKLADRAPRVISRADGTEMWLYDGTEIPNIGLNAVAGRPPSEYSREPANFADMRRGAWDIGHRVADMDLDGVYASLCFPSFLTGFGGGRLQTCTPDRDLARAATRAWNDWHIEEWAGFRPDRIIACQIAWLHDPRLAADDIRTNRERGFRALSFPEMPTHLGLPSVTSTYWDPIFSACQETGTVICLHAGSGGHLLQTSEDAPREAVAAFFGLSAVIPAIDWLFALVPVRFPGLMIVLAESGIGWVAALLDRLEHVARYHECYGDWKGTDLSPAEVLLRNFWFCTLDNPSSFCQKDRIGVENILCEVDYPHADTSWPDTQDTLRRHLVGLNAGEVDRVTWRNAAELFDFAVPETVVADPESF